MCNERVLCAGFGGQGVMTLGQLLAHAGMIENKYVTWMPSYGPEMRGGTAYCSVMVSDTPVGSPIATGNATSAIVMNLPSLLKFEKSVIPGGCLFINSSLIERAVRRNDIEVYYIPANDLADECGNAKAANIVMLGAYLAVAKSVQLASIIEACKSVFGDKAQQFAELNVRALQKGIAAACGKRRSIPVAA